MVTGKKNIGVIFGGRSVEHDISVITGQTIIAALRESGQFEVTPIYISKKGRWLTDESLSHLDTFKNFKEGNFKELRVRMGDNGKLNLSPVGGLLGSKEILVDVAFPAMHGTNGEDGALQGFLEMINIPFVGCGLNASALAMNKVATNNVFSQNDIPSVSYVAFTKDDFRRESSVWLKKIEEELRYPVFVKPANLGSSIGITRAEDSVSLRQAIEVACYYDSQILVEEGIVNLVEINCAVLGNDKPVASVLEQPVPKSEFLSFSEKYLDQGGSMKGVKSKVRIPAPLTDKKTEEIQALALKVFKVLGCAGTARVDFLLDASDNDKVYVNEINPLPGSLQQHLWKASGIPPVELVEKLVELAEERFAEKKKLTYTFDSNVLSNSGIKGIKNL